MLPRHFPFKMEEYFMAKEKKKTATEIRNEFIAKTYGIALDCIAEQTTQLRSKVEIRMTLSNYNRYIRFHKYGADMAILIYRDGKVALELSEALHSKHEEQLFDYATDADRQEVFFAELESMLSGLIKVYLGEEVTDFHTFMDYVCDDISAYDSYKQMMHEWRHSGEEE